MAGSLTAAEDLLERQIEDAYQCYLAAQTLLGKQCAFSQMRSLIQQRSAAVILRIEREKGLAPA